MLFVLFITKLNDLFFKLTIMTNVQHKQKAQAAKQINQTKPKSSKPYKIHCVEAKVKFRKWRKHLPKCAQGVPPKAGSKLSAV